MKKEFMRFISVVLCYAMLFTGTATTVFAAEEPQEAVVAADSDAVNASGIEETDAPADDEATVTEAADPSDAEEEKLEAETDDNANQYDSYPAPVTNGKFTVKFGEDAETSVDYNTIDDVFKYINAEENATDANNKPSIIQINSLGAGQTLEITKAQSDLLTNHGYILEVRFVGEVQGQIHFNGVEGINIGIDIQPVDKTNPGTQGLVTFTDCNFETNYCHVYNSRLVYEMSNQMYGQTSISALHVADDPNGQKSEIEVRNTNLWMWELYCENELPILRRKPNSKNYKFGQIGSASVIFHCGDDEFQKANTADRVKHALQLVDYLGTQNDGMEFVHIWRTCITKKNYEDWKTDFASTVNNDILNIEYDNQSGTDCFLFENTYVTDNNELGIKYEVQSSLPEKIVVSKKLESKARTMFVGDTIDLNGFDDEEGGDNSPYIVYRNENWVTIPKPELTYASGKPAVATVDENGVVTAVSKGTADITIKTKNNKQQKIKVNVVDHVTKVTLSGPNPDNIKNVSKTRVTATVSPKTNVNPDISWSLYAKEDEGAVFEEVTEPYAKITTVSTSGAITVGELSVNKPDADDNFQIKVVATSISDKNISAEKIFTLSDTDQVSGLTLKPASTTVAAVSETTINTVFIPANTDLDKRLTWSVYKVANGTETLLDESSGITIAPDEANASAKLKVNLTMNPDVINLIRVKAVPVDNKNIVATKDITVKPLVIPQKLTFDKANANAVYSQAGSGISFKVTPSGTGAYPGITASLYDSEGNKLSDDALSDKGIILETKLENTYATVTFKTDWDSPLTGKQTFTLRATSTYAYKNGTNHEVEDGDNELIYAEATIILQDRYSVSATNLTMDVGDEEKITITDHRDNKTIKATRWTITDGYGMECDDVISISDDGTVKALKAGSVTVQATITEHYKNGNSYDSYDTELCTDDGMPILTTVTVRKSVAKPTITIANGKTDLVYNDQIEIGTTEPNAKIWYKTNPTADEFTEYNGPIEVAEGNTSAVEGVATFRTIDIIAKVVDADGAESETVTSRFYVRVPDTTQGEVEDEDLAGATEEDRIAYNQQGLWMSNIPAQEYSGAKIVPDVRVYCGKKKLVAGTDYTVAVTNNINAHDATVDNKSPLVTVTLKNSYSGTLKKTFEICKASLDDAIASNYVSVQGTKEQWVVPTVTFNGKALKNNTDFTVSYPDKETVGAYKNANEDPGWKITLTGKGSFEGTKTVYLKITEGTPLAKCSIGNIGAQKYTGVEIRPKPVIKFKGKTLEEGDDEDYTLTYSDNIVPGTATVTIEAVEGSGYFGTVTKTFTITPLSIATATVTGLANKYDYLGTALTPFEDFEGNGLTVKVGEDVLTNGVDYEVTYTKNDTAGTATAKLTGKGKYGGTKSFKFAINAYDIQKDEKDVIKVIFPDEVDHNISGACPDVVVNILDPEDNTNVVRTLIEKQDYTLTYKNNKAIGDKGAGKKAPTVTIKGKGPFKGTIEKQFTIVKASLEDVTMYVNDVVYKDVKDNYVTKVKLTDQNGKVLSPGKDYDKQFVYYYEDGTPAAKGDKADRKTTMMVQVFGRGNFKGSKTCKYRISDKNLSQATCTIKADTAENLIYTGNPVYLTEEDIIVKLSGSTVRPKNDKNEPLYVIVGYEKNVNPGTASVIIRGMGPYVGDKKVSFKILKKQAP